MADQNRDDGMGEKDPPPREDALGANTFGDDKADNAGDAKIVDYPEHSDDISEEISGGDDLSSAKQS